MMHTNFAKMLQLNLEVFEYWIVFFALCDPKICPIVTLIILISGKPASLPSTLQILLELNWLTSMMILKLLSI